MAEKDESAKDEKPASSGGGIVSIAVLGVVCAASAFGVVFLFAPSAPPESAACASPVEVVTKDEALADEPVDYVELDEMLITIGDGADGRFVKVSAVIMAPKGEAGRVEQAEPMLKDAFLTYLRAVDLTDYETESFYPDLRAQLSQRAELVLGSDSTRGVLITEFLLR